MLTGDDLIAFINNEEAIRPDGKRGSGLFVYLRNLQVKVDTLKQLQVKTQAELDALLPSILDKAFKGELV